MTSISDEEMREFLSDEAPSLEEQKRICHTFGSMVLGDPIPPGTFLNIEQLATKTDEMYQRFVAAYSCGARVLPAVFLVLSATQQHVMYAGMMGDDRMRDGVANNVRAIARQSMAYAVLTFMDVLTLRPKPGENAKAFDRRYEALRRRYGSFEAAEQAQPGTVTEAAYATLEHVEGMRVWLYDIDRSGPSPVGVERVRNADPGKSSGRFMDLLAPPVGSA